MKSYPSRPELVTGDNIGSKIRNWLDIFSLTVKAAKDPESEFFYIVTTDGGKVVSISRSLKSPYSDYLLVKALWTPDGDDKQKIDSLSPDEQIALRLAVQLELSRAVIGYKLEGVDNKLTIFKRVPISHDLTETDILNAVWDVEAALHSIFTVGAMVIHRHATNQASGKAQ